MRPSGNVPAGSVDLGRVVLSAGRPRRFDCLQTVVADPMGPPTVVLQLLGLRFRGEDELVRASRLIVRKKGCDERENRVRGRRRGCRWRAQKRML